MKSFIWIIYIFSGLVFCQDLVFYNDQETIQFKEGDLININGIKYQYLGTNQNETKINILEQGLSNLSSTIQTLDISEIKSFGNYKRFKIKNTAKMTFSGFCIGSLIGPLFYNAYLSSMGFNITVYGLYLGTFTGLIVGNLYGIPIGFIYGFITPGEDKIYNKYQYKLKFIKN
jgi:hypothetical protein